MENIFKNKVVTFSIGEDNILGIENPEFQTIENKVLIIGKIPKGSTTNDWAENKFCAVSWSHVTDYIIFDSVEDYNKSIQKS